MSKRFAIVIVAGLLAGSSALAAPACRHGAHHRCAAATRRVDPARFARPLTAEEMRAKPRRLSADEVRSELDRARRGAPPSASH